jgi:8-oxo-dGTP pyrophosphatase MutT (NUDIX family)
MGAGILPVSLHNGKLHFLFGKENKYADTPGWSDFGGGIDAGETPLETVVREAQEEMTGFLGGDREIRALLRRGTYKMKFGDYTMFICPMEYNEWLPFYYNNNQRFLQKMLDPAVIRDTKIFEKSEIKWVSESGLRALRQQCRSYFRDTIGLLEAEMQAIRRFVVSTNSKKTRKRH